MRADVARGVGVVAAGGVGDEEGRRRGHAGSESEEVRRQLLALLIGDAAVAAEARAGLQRGGGGEGSTYPRCA